MRVLHTERNYRIIEVLDEDADIENLKGDLFNPEANEGIPEADLAYQCAEFMDEVHEQGVFGYVLQIWDANIGQGWDDLDSCWGFVGQYDENSDRYNHYIVDEMKDTIKSESLGA